MKISKKVAQSALQIIQKSDRNKLIITKNGEFFDEENFAKLTKQPFETFTVRDLEDIISKADKKKTPPTDGVNGKEIFEGLNSKGSIEEKKEYLEALKRNELDSMNEYFEVDLTQLQNKAECVEEMIKELSKSHNNE